MPFLLSNPPEDRLYHIKAHMEFVANSRSGHLNIENPTLLAFIIYNLCELISNLNQLIDTTTI